MPIPAAVPAQDLALQAQLLRALLAAETHDACGVACSYLLHVAYQHPDVLRRLLNEPVVKEGFRGVSLLTVLTRTAKE